MLIKETLNNDGQQFHHYEQYNTISSHLNSLKTKRHMTLKI